MKATQLSLAIFLLVSIPFVSFAQERPKLQYSVGLGSSIDAMNFLYGTNFTNELNVRLGKRTSFNTGISLYQSLGSYRDSKLEVGQKNLEQSSGLFVTPSLKYDVVQSPSGFSLAFSAGPSLQLGGETFLFNYNFDGTLPEYPTYVTNKYRRVGLFVEMEAEWNSKNPNRKNAVSLSAFGADNAIPWYLHATYKIRFALGKN
ncbi:hypothetical protein J0A67_02880 [Algoriphagus aestuariicola]|jgi:hypothetical protein|uniref:Outer membrane protein beta-barrel domain-containing protein n=1 Tax=Algoriphagus aestuariicola TaxID=1852016 RepID=A0ABS3BN72_9BACT|nr:hypothetical protein [Algoriphagus aestuariicola]MBN7799785.1 hypothetical protein [Algoriphagus aestuariicola]